MSDQLWTVDIDRQLLLTTLETYYMPKALEDSYSCPGSGVYKTLLPPVERSLEQADRTCGCR